jgi:eukaryotic-like serine/threonine-protein kinase
LATVAEVLDPSGFAPGLRFGPFRLVRMLGAGGCAQVWLAVEEGPQGFRKRVALKVVEGQGAEARTVFQTLVNEARVGGHLKHPNIVDLYRIGEVRGAWYIAMEYIEGSDLSVLLTRVRAMELALPTSIVAEIGLRIAQALDYAHNATDEEGRPLRLVHRDLKPANVMVSRGGIVKVADFGIAKATTNMKSTTVGHLKGTPCYMAPEVWRGSREFKPRMDLFSVGSMLWEMCSGARLAQGTNLAAVAGRLMFGDAREEAEVVAEHHPEMVELLTGLLQRKPRKRIQSAAEVVTELRRVLRKVARPGELDLYLSLIERGGLPMDERCATSHTLATPFEVDASWSAVFSVARGEPVMARGTLQFEAPELDFDDSMDSADSGTMLHPASRPALVSTDDVFMDQLPDLGGTHPDASPVDEFDDADELPQSFFGGLARVAAGGLVTELKGVVANSAATSNDGILESAAAAESVDPAAETGFAPAVEEAVPEADAALASEAAAEISDRSIEDADLAVSPSTHIGSSSRNRWIGAVAAVVLMIGVVAVSSTDRPADPGAEAPTSAKVEAVGLHPEVAEAPDVVAIAEAAVAEEAAVEELAAVSEADEPTVAQTVEEQPTDPRVEPTPLPTVEKKSTARALETAAPKKVRAPIEQPAPKVPAAVAATDIAPATGEGCVVFQSNPPGAEVSIDGTKAGFYARSGNGSMQRFPAGTIDVTMGQGSRTVSETVRVRAGQRVAISCSLSDPMDCRVGRARGSCE